jgi:hypothetical protein
MPLWRYCLLAFPLSVIPAMALLGIVYGGFALAGIDTSGWQPPNKHATLGQAFGSILFAPIIETLLLALGLKVLSAMTSRTALIVTASALAWGCLHAAQGFMWLFGPSWSFFVFSCAYLVWRKKSLGQAFLAAAIPHALQNSAVMTIVYLADRFN